MGIFDSMAVKYGAVMCGYTILGLPVFKKASQYKASPNEMASNITKDYIRNSSLLINLAKVMCYIISGCW
jgi:ATP-binding cassette subfamily D (ALD) protein 3